jgi:hypothetical protein
MPKDYDWLKDISYGEEPISGKLPSQNKDPQVTRAISFLKSALGKNNTLVKS